MILFLIGFFSGLSIGSFITYLLYKKIIFKKNNKWVEKWTNYDINNVLEIKRTTYPNSICNELINNIPLIESDIEENIKK